ncbi:MAG: nucleotidyltransferase family protein [Lachnospiraceae bacterium]|nr:nucleotidyltransferase family protein [Lachnospiraceae bacterium]
MEESLYKTTTAQLAQLIRFVLGGGKPSQEETEALEPEKILELAQKHSLGALAAYGLEGLGLGTAKTEAKVAGALRRDYLFESEKNALTACLGEAGIWYLVLKGSVLKHYYPMSALREMSDIDILFEAEQAEKVKEIFLQRGYSIQQFGKDNVDVYYKKPVFNFEMHRSLFAEKEKTKLYSAYYRGVKERLIPGEKPGELVFTPEDYYIFFIAHALKHYENAGGTGLRTLVDLKLIRDHYQGQLNEAYLGRELEKLGCREFEAMLRNLTDKLLEPEAEAMTREEEEQLMFIVSSGTYGSLDNLIGKQMSKGRWHFAWRTLFPPMSSVRDYYPFFYRHKILLPLLPFWRLIVGHKRNPGKGKAMLKAFFTGGKKKK